MKLQRPSSHEAKRQRSHKFTQPSGTPFRPKQETPVHSLGAASAEAAAIGLLAYTRDQSPPIAQPMKAPSASLAPTAPVLTHKHRLLCQNPMIRIKGRTSNRLGKPLCRIGATFCFHPGIRGSRSGYNPAMFSFGDVGSRRRYPTTPQMWRCIGRHSIEGETSCLPMESRDGCCQCLSSLVRGLGRARGES
jgi:hypothetical protein